MWDLILNLHTQIDIDECANDTMNNCEQRCINTQGSFLCACGTGYELNNDGMTCSGTFTAIQMINVLQQYDLICGPCRWEIQIKPFNVMINNYRVI